MDDVQTIRIYKKICFSCSLFTKNEKHDERSCSDESFCSAKRYNVVVGMDTSTLQAYYQSEYASAVFNKDTQKINSLLSKIMDLDCASEILYNASIIVAELKKESLSLPDSINQ